MRKGSVVAGALVAGLALLPALPSPAADGNKTLRVAFETAETGFDPQAINDNYSFMVCDSIFDALYTYDYFARPPRLVPNTAAGDAGDHRWRAHVHDQGEAGHLLRGRPRVQGQAARARPPRTTSTASSGSSIRACARRRCTSSSISCGPGRRARRGAPRRASSTTTRRSKACRRSIATRCASGSAIRTTCSSTGSPTSRSPPSRARSSSRTRTSRIA